MKTNTFAALFGCAALLLEITCRRTDGEMEAYPARDIAPPKALEVKSSPEGDYIEYVSFGAAGDGRHGDCNVLPAAHRYANEKGLPSGLTRVVRITWAVRTKPSRYKPIPTGMTPASSSTTGTAGRERLTSFPSRQS